MPDLDLDDLVRDARTLDRPSTAAQERIWEGLSALGAPAAAPAAAATGFFASKKVLLLGGVALLGGALATGAAPVWEAPPPAPNQEDSAATPLANEEHFASHDAATGARDPETALPSEVRDAGPAGHPPDALPSSRPDVSAPTIPEKPSRPLSARPEAPRSTLAEELDLLRRAKVALDAGTPSESLRLLDEYESRFPRGELRSEAHGTRVLALCALERRDQALAQARQIDPRSPLSKSLKSGCKAR